MALTLDIASNTRDFIKGTNDVEKALEDVSDSLDDVSRDGERSAEKLERSFSEAQREISEDARKAARDVEQESSRGFGLAGEAATGFKEEAISNFSEVASSFDGTMQGLADGIQGTLGGLALGLSANGGPLAAVGIGAGLMGAVFGAVMTQMGEDTEATKQRVAELTTELIETKDRGGPSIEWVIDKLKELAVGGEEADRTLEDINRTADKGEQQFRRLAQAYAGAPRELEQALAAARKEMDELGPSLAGSIRSDREKRRQALEEIIGDLERVQEETNRAAEAERLWLESGGPEMQAKAETIALVNDAYDDTASAIEDFIDAETGIFDVQAYIDAMTARSEALKNYQANLATAELSPEARAGLNSMGYEAAAAALAGYVSATPEQQAELDRIWSELASESSGTFRRTVSGKFAEPIQGPEIKMDPPDLSAVDRALDEWAGRSRSVRITADVYSRTGEKLY